MSESRSADDRGSGPTIRPATSDDAAALAKLAAATFVETFGHLYAPADLDSFLAADKTEESYARLLLDPDVFALLAVVEADRPVGFAVAGPCKLPVPDLEPTAGELRELYVLASHQGQRLGTRLLEAALNVLHERGRAPLYVGVWSQNEGAQRLYGRYGFEKVGEYDFPVGSHLDREFILRRGG